MKKSIVSLIFVFLLLLFATSVFAYTVSFEVKPISHESVEGAATLTDSIAVGDIDGDGDLDIVNGNRGEDYWFENQLPKGFIPHQISDYSAWTESLVLADLDSDGDLDIVAGADLATYTFGAFWYENDGDGNFMKYTLSTENRFVNSVAVADMDGDGDLDVVEAGCCDAMYLHENRGRNESLNGRGEPDTGVSPIRFEEAFLIGNYREQVNDIEIVDIDFDGDFDIVAAFSSIRRNRYYENNGDLTFTMRSFSGSNGFDSRTVEIGDVDGDGDLDVVFGNRLDVNFWYESYAPGAFRNSPTELPDSYSGHALHLSDLDADGDLDIVEGLGQNVCERLEENVNAYYENDGEGSFERHSLLSDDEPLHCTYAVATGDLNSDGRVDIVEGNAMYYPHTLRLNYWYDNLGIPEPDIFVRQGITEIPSGTGVYDFGAFPVGRGTKVVFTIENTGNEDLSVGKITISGMYEESFVLLSTPAEIVEPGESTSFVISFSPLSEGFKKSVVSIDNSDPDEDPYEFLIIGIGE